MNIYQDIINRAKPISETELVRQLGYSNIAKGTKTLKAFMKAGNLKNWLQSSHFDMVHSSRSFLKRLAEIVDIDKKELEEEISIFDAYSEALSKATQPYIFVDTLFKRKGEPIFILAMMEGDRRIMLRKAKIFEMKIDDVLAFVSMNIKSHFRQHGGVLKVWGKISEYRYHHIDGSVYRFNTNGEMLGMDEGGAVLFAGER